MSAPAPGPNGMIQRTGRCGQLCAWALETGAARRMRLPKTPMAAARRKGNEQMGSERIRFLRRLLSQSWEAKLGNRPPKDNAYGLGFAVAAWMAAICTRCASMAAANS